MSIPMKRKEVHIWRPGDTFSTIALKYCRPHTDYLEVYNLNIRLIHKEHFCMRPGLEIEIPEHWVPIAPQSYGIKLQGSHGRRV